MFLLSAVVYQSISAAQVWQDHFGSSTGGGISDSAWNSGRATAVVADDGTVIVSWEEDVLGERNAFLKAAINEAWTGIGGSGSGFGARTYIPTIAYDNNGRLHAAYLQDPESAGGDFYLDRYNGVSWDNLFVGAASESSLSSDPLFVKFDLSDNPTFGGTAGASTGHFFYVYTYNGSTWSANNPSTLQYYYSPAIARGPTGDFWLVADHGNENQEFSDIDLFKYSGGAWTLVATLTNRDASKRASIAVDSQNRPVVAYMSGSTVSPFPPHGFSQFSCYVARWNGSIWTEFDSSNSGDGISTPPHNAGLPSVVLDDDDLPIVAFIEHNDNGHWIRVRRFDRAQWTEFGDGSDTYPGLGNNAGIAASSVLGDGYDYPDHHKVSLARNVNGRYFCVWENSDGSNIYGKVLDINPQGSPVRDYTYGYDEIDRLTQISSDNGVRIAYEYDPAGNRNQKIVTSQLVVRSGDQNPELSGASTSETNAPILQIACETNAEENVTLNGLTVQASGSGDESTALTDARLWIDANLDGVVDGGDTQLGPTLSIFGNDDQISFTGLNQMLTASSTTHLLMTYTFNGAPALGDQFKLEILNRHMIDATGESTGNDIYVLGTPVSGPQITISNDNTNPSFSGLDTATAQSAAVQLDWTVATDATSPITYRIWQSTTPFGGSVSGVPVYSTTDSSFLVTGLTNGQTYYFVVRAEDGVGNRETNTVERNATPQAITYSLAVNAVNGSAFPLPPDGVYEDSTEVSLIPNPDEGYAFAGWTGDVPGGQELDDPLILTMDADKSVAANFASAVGTVQVDTTPDDAPWSFVDSMGAVHNGVGDDTLSPIPTGGIEMTWQEHTGYLVPPVNPAIDLLLSGGNVTLTGAYVLPVDFTSQPQSLKRYLGESANFSVTTSGGLGASRYKWKFDDGANPVTGVGGNSATYSIPFVTLSHNGSYTCEVEDDYPAVYNSATAILQVAPHLTITSHPQDATKHEQQSYTFTVSTTGGIGAKSYVWRKGATIIPGATGPSHTIFSLTLDDAGSYSVTISDEHTDVVVSNAAVLTVNEGALPLGTSRYFAIRFVSLALLLIVFGGSLVLRRKDPRKRN